MTSPSSTDLQAAVDTARGFRVSSLSLGLDRLGASGSPALAAAIGFALVVVIALADYLTAGLWLFAFGGSHYYSHDLYFGVRRYNTRML